MLYTLARVAAFFAAWLLVVRIVDWLGRAAAERVGLAGWARRVEFDQRRLSRPGLWKSFEFAAASATGTGAMAIALVARPQDPWERHDALYVFGLACVLGLLAAVLGRRWWRGSGGVADAGARRTP